MFSGSSIVIPIIPEFSDNINYRYIINIKFNIHYIRYRLFVLFEQFLLKTSTKFVQTFITISSHSALKIGKKIQIYKEVLH